MRAFTILSMEKYEAANAIITRTLEALEVPPIPESEGGCIIRTKTIIVSGWLFKKYVVSESTTFAPNITIKQIKQRNNYE